MDTLEIAKKLESAGFARQQAEAVASVRASGAGERDEQLDDLRGGMGKIEVRLDRVEERLDKVEERLDKVEERLGKVEERLGRVETSIEALGHRLEAQIARAQFQVIVWTVGALGVLAAIIRVSLSQ